MTYQFIDQGDRKLLIKRIFKEHQLKPNFNVDVMRKWTGTDIILRKNGIFYCCETLQDVTLVEPEIVPIDTDVTGSTLTP